MDSEVTLVLLQEVDGVWRPAGLPLWGRYEGLGSAAEIGDGPNADLILGGFQRALSEEALSIDFAQMGLAPQEMDHIETLCSVIACSQLTETGAVWTEEGPLGFALMAAHVAAVAMDADPRLKMETAVEDLASLVFDTQFSRSLYEPLPKLPVKLRCRFGLSLAGLLALDQEMERLGIPWTTPGPGINEAESNPALWMAEAMVKFADNVPMIEALEDHAAQDPEEE